LASLSFPEPARIYFLEPIPAFEFDVPTSHTFLNRAKAGGATVVLDGLNDETVKSLVIVSQDGDEFELCASDD
jgi:hypothetical protein